jgi:hypothetical protein
MTKPTDEDIEAFFRGLQDGADADLFPKMRGSRFVVNIVDGQPDVKMCLELGAAMFFDKPLIVLVKRGAWIIAPRLRQLADAVIEFDEDFQDPAVRAQIETAMKRLMEKPKTQ